MPVDIVPIEEGHIEGFHRTLDFVARERLYLSFLEAPPLESMRVFVLDIIKRGRPEFVVVSAGEVVGWCDILPKDRPTRRRRVRKRDPDGRLVQVKRDASRQLVIAL